MKLVYHRIDTTDGAKSPFERALSDAAESDGAVDLACPYLDVDKLRELIRPTSKWRLVTDLSEWLRSARDRSLDVVDLLREHMDSVRDCRNLHAKVAIGPRGALVGSANFTASGLEHRTEMAVWIDDPRHVKELRTWYTLLWDHSEPVETMLETVSRQSEQLSSLEHNRPAVAMS